MSSEMGSSHRETADVIAFQGEGDPCYRFGLSCRRAAFKDALGGSMRRCLLAAVSVLVVSIRLAAQEPLWSGTMAAGKDEINGVRIVGYNRNPEVPVMGELSDTEFDFRGTTYRVYSLLQAENNPLLREWAVVLSFSPLLDHQDLESMTLTVDGTVLPVSDSVAVADEASDDPPWTSLYWADPASCGRPSSWADDGTRQPQPAMPASRPRCAGAPAPAAEPWSAPEASTVGRSGRRRHRFRAGWQPASPEAATSLHGGSAPTFGETSTP